MHRHRRNFLSKKRYDSNFAGAVDTHATYNYYFMRLLSIAISCFEWENLPDGIDSRFLETTLLYNSNALFFKDEVLGNLVLPVALGGNFDVYGIPVTRRAYAVNGYQAERDTSNSVVIYDNLLHMSLLPIIEMFCKRLTNLEITKDINLRAQKTPILMQCTESQRLTLENLFMKIDCSTPVIYADKALDLDSLKVLNLQAPYLVGNLQTEKLNVLQEAYNFLGVGGLEIEKRERLLTREIAASQEASFAQRENRLKAREQAAEQINRMFNLNITVKYSNSSPIEGDDIV